MSNLKKVAEEFAQLLNNAGIEGTITGGFALILRDSYRITEDADFDVNVGGRGAERLISALEEDDRFEFVTKDMEPAPTPRVEDVEKGTIFSVKRAVGEEEYKIDIIPHQPDFMDILKTDEVQGLTVVVPEVIIAEKLWLIEMGESRGRDYDDIARIIGNHDVDEEYLRKILNLIEVNYELYESVKSSVEF